METTIHHDYNESFYQIPQGYTREMVSKKLSEIKKQAKERGVRKLPKKSWAFLSECGIKRCGAIEDLRWEISKFYRFTY